MAQRIGRVEVARPFVDEAREMLNRYKILGVKADDFRATVEYTILCDEFDPIEDGAEVPYYTAWFTTHADKYTVEWKRHKEDG